ncbi:nucleoside hydrolase [Plantibacter sp. Mn2098]|uniref:nucleoside hydrolase n=1 Tax=Plantibacter sp. Mn2098 TaxID=3395266 RepID=UPI003BE13267
MSTDDVDILGVSCVAGNVSLARVVENTMAWLDLCSATGIEVCAGADRPLQEPLREETVSHGASGLGYAVLPTSTRLLSERSAVELWVETVRARPGEVIGIATGPLTNIAYALQVEPRLLHLLKRLVIMGGSFHHQGNTTPTAEWNIAVDPEAAKIVADASAGLPGDWPIWVGLNVTERISLTPLDVESLQRLAGSEPVDTLSPSDEHGITSTINDPLIRAIVDAARYYFEGHLAEGDGYRAFLHDPAAAALAVDLDLATLTATRIDIELDGTLTRGQTVADFKHLWGGSPNARVVTDFDASRFTTTFIRTTADLARRLRKEH